MFSPISKTCFQISLRFVHSFLPRLHQTFTNSVSFTLLDLYQWFTVILFVIRWYVTKLLSILCVNFGLPVTKGLPKGLEACCQREEGERSGQTCCKKTDGKALSQRTLYLCGTFCKKTCRALSQHMRNLRNLLLGTPSAIPFGAWVCNSCFYMA